MGICPCKTKIEIGLESNPHSAGQTGGVKIATIQTRTFIRVDDRSTMTVKWIPTATEYT